MGTYKKSLQITLDKKNTDSVSRKNIFLEVEMIGQFY